jgi:hypothetical protein
MASVDGHLVNGSRCVKPAEGDKPAEWESAPASVPTQKPHGRLAWSVHLGYRGNLYVDISVMPRAST